MNVRLRKIIKFVLISLFLVAILLQALYWFPLRKSVDLKMSGVIIDDKGNVIQNSSVSIKGYFGNYLLRNKKNLVVDIDFDEDTVDYLSSKIDCEAEKLFYKTTDTSLHHDGSYVPYYLTTYLGFAGKNYVVDCADYFYLSLDNKYVLLKSFGEDDCYLIASVNTDFDVEEIMEMFGIPID